MGRTCTPGAMRRGNNGEPSPSPGDAIGRLLRLLSEATDGLLAAELECLVAEYAVSDLRFARVSHDALVLREVRSGMALFSSRHGRGHRATGLSGVFACVSVLAAVPDSASIWHGAIPQMFADLEQEKVREPHRQICFLATHEFDVLYAGTEDLRDGSMTREVHTRSSNGGGEWTSVVVCEPAQHALATRRFSCTVRGGDDTVGLAAAPAFVERGVVVWWPLTGDVASWTPSTLCVGGGTIASSGDHLVFLGELASREHEAAGGRWFVGQEERAQDAWTVAVLRMHRERGLSVAAQGAVYLGAVPPPQSQFYHHAYRRPLLVAHRDVVVVSRWGAHLSAYAWAAEPDETDEGQEQGQLGCLRLLWSVAVRDVVPEEISDSLVDSMAFDSDTGILYGQCERLVVLAGPWNLAPPPHGR